MKIVFATNNAHKLEEAAAILGPGFELVTPASLGITGDIPETQPTLEGNALQKARYIYERARDMNFCVAKSAVGVISLDNFRASRRLTNGSRSMIAIPTFADDTGLEVTALDGAPGVRSARYAGDRHDFDENNRLLLKNLEGAADRSARFRTVVALILVGRDGAPEEHLFEGRAEGHIIDEYRGTGGFGYDPVFIPEGGGRTFAEMSAAEKNALSHRARALRKLKDFLSNSDQNS